MTQFFHLFFEAHWRRFFTSFSSFFRGPHEDHQPPMYNFSPSLFPTRSSEIWSITRLSWTFLCLSSLHHYGKPVHFKEKGTVFSIRCRGLKQALPPTKMSMILNTKPCSLLEHWTCPDCDKPFLFFSDHRAIFHIQHCGSHNFPPHLLLDSHLQAPS